MTLQAVDVSTGLPKASDGANITVYVSKDDGTVTALTDTSATEASATNAPGDYLFDLTQAETNANKLRFSGKSSTSNVIVIPQTIYTLPAALGNPSYDMLISAVVVGPPGKITLPATFADGVTSVIDGAHAYHQLEVVGGTGAGQIVVLTVGTGTTREYYVKAGTMLTPLDATSQVIDLGLAPPSSDTVGRITVAPAGLDPVIAYTDAGSGNTVNMRQAACLSLVGGMGVTAGFAAAGAATAAAPTIAAPGTPGVAVTVNTDKVNRDAVTVTPPV